MKCFDHIERDAIGICGQCGRGLCRDCYAEVNGGLFCKGKGCSAKRGKKVHYSKGIGVLSQVLGGVFILIAGFSVVKNYLPVLGVVTGICGLVLCLLGLYFYKQSNL